MRTLVVLVTTASLLGCDQENWEDRQKREAFEAWVAPCQDTATLLATTAGSPSQQTCPNQNHVMRVQAASGASNEEFGAVVFCRCKRPWDGVAGGQSDDP